VRRHLAVLLTAALAVLLAATPAAAENPVLDPEDDAEIAESLAEATEVQDVCYGYLLQVYDDSTGQFQGSYAVSGAGPGVAASQARGCTKGYVELRAQIVYTSDYSESEDSAAWDVVSSLGAGTPTTGDLGDLGLSSSDLLDDGAAPLALRNAVLGAARPDRRLRRPAAGAGGGERRAAAGGRRSHRLTRQRPAAHQRRPARPRRAHRARRDRPAGVVVLRTPLGPRVPT
jgi:hypothetical protein